MSRSYYLPEDASPFLRTLRNRILRKPLAQHPETVLIETQSNCNARCVFCPIGDDDIRNRMPTGRMPEALFEKIVAQLEEAPPRHIIPCFANEPFLDKRLIDWLGVLKRRLPTSQVTVVTNGSLLTDEVVDRLLDEQVPDVLNVSFHGVDKISYEASMGPLDFDVTLARVVSLIERKRERGLRRPEIRASMIATKLVEDGIEKARRFWKELGVELDVDRVENRGGSVPIGDLAEMTVPFTDCRRPFNTLVIAFDGSVPLCCVDFERKAIVGNVNGASIHEIWNSETLMEIRRGFLDPDHREALPETCRECRLAE